MNYLYHVQGDGLLTTVQAAIYQIQTDLATGEAVADDIVVTIGRGVYPSFLIPDGTTQALAGTSYKLIIRSAGDYFPIIDYNVSTSVVGVDVGSGNPNVRIERLRVQHFAVGIRAGLNSHEVGVKDCLVTNNRNAGIWVEQCDQTKILQNVCVNGDFGIVVHLCKDAALLHNTVFVDGSLSNEEGVARAAVWAAMAHDYGGGLSDSGTLHLLGNILWNLVGPALLVQHDDLERGAIVSDYNDLVLGQSHLVELQDRVFFREDPTARHNYTTLQEWKEAQQDRHSISADPKFVRPSRNRRVRGGYQLDLSVLSISPALGLVPSYYADSGLAATLPSYVDSAEFSKDILGNPRLRNGTAAGANEKASHSGYYGQDVFAQPLDPSIDKNCEIDPLHDLILKKLDLWFPKIKAGYFYSREREYYLYAGKVCQHLGQMAATYFQLPWPIVEEKPIRVSVSGVPAEDFDIRGDVLILYHRSLPITTGEEEVLINCSIRQWGSNGFKYEDAEYLFKISWGKTRFFFREDFVPTAPVVVTDDCSSLRDQDLLSNREFTTPYDEVEGKTELVLANNQNLLHNSQFDYEIGWGTSDNVVFTTGSQYHGSAMGDYCAVIPGTGYLDQVVTSSSGESCFSWHDRLVSGTGVATWSAEFLDADLNSLGVTLTSSYPTTDQWTRHYVSFGVTGDPFAHTAPEVVYQLSGLGCYPVPSQTRYVELKVGFSGEGEQSLSAMQYEMQVRPSMYHRRVRFNELTVEYETKDTGEFIDYRQAISPVRSHTTQGFLHIPELPASHYDGPKQEWITTLFEFRWPEGRKQWLPWARTTGKDKLRKRVTCHEVPEPHREIATANSAVAYPSECRVNPNPAICRLGDTNGQGLVIRCTDTNGNPYGLAGFTADVNDAGQKFPGWLSKRHFGLKEQLGQSVFGKLDTSGSVYLTWHPPGAEQTQVQRRVPQPSTQFQGSHGERLSVIEVPYSVNPDFFGNVTLQTETGALLPTKGSRPIYGRYEPKYSGNTSVVQLEYPPVPGTVRVWVGDTPYTENSTIYVETEQFYVDYTGNTILVNGRAAQVAVEFLPSLIFTSTTDPTRFFLYHDQVFGSYDSTILISYDILLRLNVLIQYPGNNGFLRSTFSLIGQNPMLASPTKLHPAALEF